MNKIFTLLALGMLSLQTQAQTRLSLYEEFTGEQCFPCTAINPSLQSMMMANATKVVHIAYPSPFPVAGPVYTTYKTISDARINYYGISTAPQGRLNGTVLGSGTSSPVAGHVANLRQADINSAYAVPSPFNLTATHTWNSTGDSITVQISINTPSAYAPPGAAFRLRIALIESLHFTIPPGINGEQDFPNTVREMYPSASGTILNGAWTASQSTSFSVKGLAPKFANKENANIIAWIQNETDKSVQQVAVSTIVPIALDASIAFARPIAKLQCAAGAASIPSVAVLRNAGSATMISAKIYFRSDGSALSYYPWSGNLGPGSSTSILLPAVSVGAGNHVIIDSVVSPNGAVDINAANNVAVGPVSIYNTVGIPLPIANGFEGLGGAVPTGWVMYDADSNGRNFVVARNIFGGNVGFANSTYFLQHNNYYVPVGETNFAILPKGNLPNGSKLLTFALAHAPYAAENDQLDVMYSMDCGNSWTSVWNGIGSAMTATAATSNFFIPAQSDWETKSVDMSLVPLGAMIAFRAISDFGNCLYIDNVHLSSPAGITNVPALHSLSVFPNPAAATATLRFGINQASDVTIELIDAVGRNIHEIPAAHYGSGVQEIRISLEDLVSGIYFLRIRAEDHVKTLSLTRI